MQVEHALVAAEVGADFVGLMFAPSPRQITLEQAAAILSALRLREGAAPQPEPVAVFANAPIAEVQQTLRTLGLRTVQLSGTEDDDYVESMADHQVIKAVHVTSGLPLPVAIVSVGRALAALREQKAIAMLDAKVDARLGGTGQRFDHEIARSLAESYSFLLAGGLTPENVGQAVAAVHPWGVDVSSGVETNGVKDVAKMRAFVAAVRQTR